MEPNDSRLIDRIRRKLLVTVGDQVCVMEDLSLFGMRVNSPVLLKKTEVDIRFQADEKVLNLKGRISWIRKSMDVYNQAQYQVGIYIPEPDGQYVELVKSWFPE